MTNYCCGPNFESGSCRKGNGWTDWAENWQIIYIYYDDHNTIKSDQSNVYSIPHEKRNIEYSESNIFAYTDPEVPVSGVYTDTI